MSKNDKQHALVPRLRFPEFQNTPAWKHVPLQQLAERITTRNSDESTTRVLTNSAEHGVMDQRDYFDKDIATKGNLGSYYVVAHGDYVYNPRTSSAAPVGPISRNNVGQGVMSPLYTVFRFNRGETDFHEHYLKSSSWHTYLRSVSSKGARHDRMSITNGDFMRMPVPDPHPKEQRKIADCLGSLDCLIAAEGRKLAALRQHKKGLMQQLFPREGETRPHIRFPEFRDAPEWEPQSIGQICQILNNRRVPITSSDRVPGPYPYFGASGIVDYVDDYIFDERLVLVGEDGAKWKAFEPTAFIADGRYWVNNHAHVLKPIGLIDTLLANYLTLLDIGGYVTGAAPPKLTLRKLKTIPIPVPPTDDEQQRIADCLASLDAMIAAQADKLDALREHKRGLMQQLFPSPEDAAA